MTEENNYPDVLYHEYIGGGDDVEGEIPNGIVVTLTYWHSTQHFLAPRHYTLHKKVMINRDVCVDVMEIIRDKGIGFKDQANLFRMAISCMEKLKELYPDLVMEHNHAPKE